MAMWKGHWSAVWDTVFPNSMAKDILFGIILRDAWNSDQHGPIFIQEFY